MGGLTACAYPVCDIKPAKDGRKGLVQKTRECIKGMLGQTAETLIKTLNPIIRGWANYHRHICAARTFAVVDRIIRLSRPFALWRYKITCPMTALSNRLVRHALPAENRGGEEC